MTFYRLVKDWTLPMAMLCGTVIYLVFAFVPFLDGAARFFDPIFDTILPLFMFLILFVTFCKVDFRRLRPVKWHFWVGVFQVLIVLILVGLILGFEMSGNSLILMEAMLTCVIGPWCGGSSRCYAETWRQFGGDDHLYFPFQLHHSGAYSDLFPYDRDGK